MATKDATTEGLFDLFAQGRCFQYQRGDIILRESDSPLAIYYIESGYAKAYTLTEEGEENLLFIFKAGELFPLNLLAKDNTRIVFHEALTATTVWRLSTDKLGALLRENVDLAMVVLRHASEQLSNLLDRIDNLEYTSSYERVVHRLLYLAHRFGKTCEEGVVIDLPVTQQEIAGSINLARETASRAIEKLEREGLINYQAHRLLILDLNQLAARIHIDTSPLPN